MALNITQQNNILVSVVIPLYNDEIHINKCLDSLLNQTIPFNKYEVIVVDDGSIDNSANIVKSYKEIIYTRQENSGPSKARNVGIEIAKGKYIAFTDSDCICPPFWLEKLTDCIEKYGYTIAGIGSGQISPKDEKPYGKNIQHFLESLSFIGGYLKSETKCSETDHNASCNVIYRKEALVSVKGFRIGLFPGEDVDVDKRLINNGFKIMYLPGINVMHYRPSEKWKWYRMLFLYGSSSGNNVKIHGYFRVHHYIPWFILSFFMLSAFLFFVSMKFFSIFTGITSLFYIIFIIIKSKSLKLINIVLGIETVLLFTTGYFWALYFKREQIW